MIDKPTREYPGEDKKMATCADLLNAVKANNDGCSDYFIAKKLGIRSGQICDYRHERRFPTKPHLIELCEMGDQDPAYWLFSLEARKAKTARIAAKMQRVAKRYA